MPLYPNEPESYGAPQVQPNPYSAPAGTPKMGSGGGASGFRDRARSAQRQYDTQQEQQRVSRAAPAYGGTNTAMPSGGWNPYGPQGQTSYNGKSDISATNGFNQANIWKMTYDGMRQTEGDWQQNRGRASDSRGRADAQAGSYQMPNYTAPADFSYGAWGGQRAPMATDEDFGNSVSRYGQIMRAQGGAPIQSQDAEATDVGGYGDAFYRYANAGANMLQTRMKDTHRTLTDNAASRGRLNTGFFDEDTGEAYRTIGREAQDSINANALDAARLDMEPGMQNARLRTQVSEGNADRNMQGQRYAQDDRQYLMDFAGGREDARGARADNAYEFDRGAYGDDRDFAYGVYGDSRDFGRGNFENDRNFGRDTFESDRTYNEDRYRFDEDMARNDRDSYLDQVAGARDWREGQTQNEKAEAAQGGFWENLGGTVLGGVAGALGGPIGAAAGKYVGGKVFGGGGSPSASQGDPNLGFRERRPSASTSRRSY